MPIFEVATRDGAIRLRVQAACMTCARRVAAENAGPEGTLVWRDSEQSRVALSDPKPTSGSALLERLTNPS